MSWPLLALLIAAAAPEARFSTVVSGLEKLRPGATPPKDVAQGRVSLARGECEGLQVFAAPPLAGVDARVEPLRGPGGKKLVPRVYREGFVPVRTPSNGQGAKGLWPDPLIPVVDAYAGERRRALPWPSTPEQPLVLYVELCAAEEERPGTYRGTLRLEAKGRAPEEIALTAEVQPFTLPATSSLPNSFGISIYSLSKGHQLDAATPAARELLREYGKALLAHRLSAYGMGIDPPPVRFEHGRAVVDFEAYDRELGPFLEGTALPSGARFTTTDVRDSRRAQTDDEKAAYYRAIREHFARKGWRQQLFLYAKDEPKPADYPLVLTQARRARAAGGVPVLITSSLSPALAGAADILCPTLNCFFPRAGPATCPAVLGAAPLRAALRPGAKVWWYQSCNAHGCEHGPFEDPAVERVYSGWASYMVDHPATANRAMGALAFVNGIDGELYFDTVYAYNTLDPWSDVFTFGGNGDGTLFYPGTPARLGGSSAFPVESLRLKQIRDGLEDYEYLRLLERQGDLALARASARTLVRSGYEIASDPARWEAVRRGWSERLARQATR